MVKLPNPATEPTANERPNKRFISPSAGLSLKIIPK